jgi:adenylate kinase family enzyme
MEFAAPGSRHIVLIGAVASGKSTIARLLSTELSWPVYSFGAYVRDQAKRHCIPPHRAELERFGSSLIATRGHDNFLRDVLGTHVSYNPFILEGVRHVDMLRAVKRCYSSALSIYLEVPTDLRYQRWRLREGFADDTASRALFDDIAEGEVERYVSALIYAADHIVDATRPTRLIAAEIVSLLEEPRR